MIGDYIETLYKEITNTAPHIINKKIQTIYLGGGTPNVLSPEQLTGIVDFLGQHFDTSEIMELNIELNPYPTQEIYNLISYFHTHFKKRPRLRFSFGIQTFDNQILQDVRRPVSFGGLTDFLRGLREIKQENMVFNFDFIAFGKFGETRKGEAQLWDPGKIDFFDRFASSQFADSFSLYTLELFPGSKWQSKTPDQAISGTYYGSDDDIFAEFAYLKDIILDAWYHRYESSNFSKPGVSSIHNRVYRTMQNYIGFWPSASSFSRLDGLGGLDGLGRLEGLDRLGRLEGLDGLGGLDKEVKAVRWTNTSNLVEYLKGDYIDQSKTVFMTEKDLLIESFFLWLRTDTGVSDLDKYISILVKNYKELVEAYKDEWLLYDVDDRLLLTDKGMDVSNTIITDLLKDI